MARRNLLEDALASLHEAALDDARWSEASGLLDRVCESKGNILVTGDGVAADDIDIFSFRACYRGQRREDIEREYRQTYYPIDERIPRIRRLPDAKVTHVDALYTAKEKKTSVAYNEGLAMAETGNCLNVRLDGPHGSRVVWAVANPIDNRGWTGERVQKVKRLLPHLRQYVRVRQALADARALGATSVTLLENTRCGVLQLDRRGRIVEANDIARSLLRKGDVLQDEQGFLIATTPEDNDALQMLLAQALPRFDAQGASGSLNLNRASVASRLMFHVQPVSSAQSDTHPSRIAALVLVINPAIRAKIDASRVAAAFGLTPAQSQIAVLLAKNHSVRDIAEMTNRRLSTIRWHTKQIYQRLDISGQSELVGMVMGLPDALSLRL